jgi:hypothetical protein
LKSALEADIEVAPEAIERVLNFFEKCGNSATGLTGYMLGHRGTTPLRTAVGLIVQQFITEEPAPEFSRNAAEYLRKQATQRKRMTKGSSSPRSSCNGD